MVHSYSVGSNLSRPTGLMNQTNTQLNALPSGKLVRTRAKQVTSLPLHVYASTVFANMTLDQISLRILDQVGRPWISKSRSSLYLCILNDNESDYLFFNIIKKLQHQV